jgi:hypothetical protein
MAGIFDDLLGTIRTSFQLGINGLRLKNASGRISARNAADSADVNFRAAALETSADAGIVINADAAGSGADWPVTIARPASGMAAPYTLTVPPTPGTAGQILRTDGAGNTDWVTNPTGAEKLSFDTTSFVFGSASPISMFTLPANAIVGEVVIYVDTAFNGTPSLSIGVAGTASKYLASTQVDLTQDAEFRASPGLLANGSPEAIIATYAAGSATVGAGRIVVQYAVPA